MRGRGAALAIVLTLFAAPTFAQQQEPAATVAPGATTETAETAPLAAATPDLAERIEIGLSTDTIAITSDFAGADLTIFGAVDNIDPLVQRQGRYDVVVILEGPTANVMARRKARVFGIWMNVDSLGFSAVPESFLIASTRPSQDVTDAETLTRLALGINDIRLRPVNAGAADAAEIDDFSAAVRRLKQDGKLYQEFPSGVRFISQSLFRATMRLPANVPLGRHIARAYLFRQGTLVAQTQSTLDIRKAGAEYQLYTAAKTQSLLYGIVSVALALLIGWLGRVMFRKD